MTTPAPTTVPTSRFVRAIVLFILASISQYGGAAFAVQAFAVIPAVAVAWWRMSLAAIVLIIWRRPWRRGFTAWKAAVPFGLSLTAMNMSFYMAIDRIPMGTTVALEFLGPVIVAAIAGRGWRQRVALTLGATGVLTIGGLGLDWNNPDTPLGLFFALLAGLMWGIYVWIGARLSAEGVNGIDALAVGMLYGAIFFAPMSLFTPAEQLTVPATWVALIGIAIASSVVPYVVDQLNFGILPAATFAILLALLPATSVIIGAVVLAQVPNTAELLGLGLISLAVLFVNSPEKKVSPETKEIIADLNPKDEA